MEVVLQAGTSVEAELFYDKEKGFDGPESHTHPGGVP
jgi:hypothetical protein